MIKASQLQGFERSAGLGPVARIHTVTVLCFVAAVALAGGASRADAISQVMVRTAAVVAICVALTLPRLARSPVPRVAWWFLAAVALMITLQLLPLPPAIWISVPGRAPYIDAAAMLQLPQPWRPLNLTPDFGWNALLALLPAFAVLILLARAAGPVLNRAMGVVAAVALASALLGLAQMAGGTESSLRYYQYTNIGSPTGLLANRNHQALLMTCALPIIARWAAYGTTSRLQPSTRASMAGAGTAVLLLLIVASGSRAGLLLALPATAAAIFFWRPVFASWLSRRGRRGQLLVTVGGIAMIFTFAVILILADRTQSLDRLFGDDEGDMRLAWLAPSWTMFRTFFPWGSGLGSFASTFTRFETLDLLGWNYANQAHNDFLQVAIEGGIAGIGLVVAYLVWWTSHCIRLWRSRRSASGGSLGALGAVVSGLIVAASIVDYPLRTPLLSSLFALASIWLASASRSVDDDEDRGSSA